MTTESLTATRTTLLGHVREHVHNRAAIELQLAELSKLADTLSVLLDRNDTETYWRGNK